MSSDNNRRPTYCSIILPPSSHPDYSPGQKGKPFSSFRLHEYSSQPALIEQIDYFALSVLRPLLFPPKDQGAVQAKGPREQAITETLIDIAHVLIPKGKTASAAGANFAIMSDLAGITLREVYVVGGKTYGETDMFRLETEWEKVGRDELARATGDKRRRQSQLQTQPRTRNRVQSGGPSSSSSSSSFQRVSGPPDDDNDDGAQADALANAAHLTQSSTPTDAVETYPPSASGAQSQSTRDNVGIFKPDLIGFCQSIPPMTTTALAPVGATAAGSVRKSKGSTEPGAPAISTEINRAQGHKSRHSEPSVSITPSTTITTTTTADDNDNGNGAAGFKAKGKRKAFEHIDRERQGSTTASAASSINTKRLHDDLKRGKSSLVFVVGEVKPVEEKTKEGFIQGALQVLKAFEMCGCWIAIVVIKDRFARMAVMQDGRLAIETLDRSLWKSSGVFGEYLLEKLDFQHIPHVFFPNGPQDQAQPDIPASSSTPPASASADANATTSASEQTTGPGQAFEVYWETLRTAAALVGHLPIDQPLERLIHPSSPDFPGVEPSIKDVWQQVSQSIMRLETEVPHHAGGSSSFTGAGFLPVEIRMQQDLLPMLLRVTDKERLRRLTAAERLIRARTSSSLGLGTGAGWDFQAQTQAQPQSSASPFDLVQIPLTARSLPTTALPPTADTLGSRTPPPMDDRPATRPADTGEAARDDSDNDEPSKAKVKEEDEQGMVGDEVETMHRYHRKDEEDEEDGAAGGSGPRFGGASALRSMIDSDSARNQTQSRKPEDKGGSGGSGNDARRQASDSQLGSHQLGPDGVDVYGKRQPLLGQRFATIRPGPTDGDNVSLEFTDSVESGSGGSFSIPLSDRGHVNPYSYSDSDSRFNDEDDDDRLEKDEYKRTLAAYAALMKKQVEVVWISPGTMSLLIRSGLRR